MTTDDNRAPGLSNHQLWCATLVILSCIASIVILAVNHISTETIIVAINILVLPCMGLFFQSSNRELLLLVQRQSDVIASLPAIGGKDETT